jgi:hypothetical protein
MAAAVTIVKLIRYDNFRFIFQRCWMRYMTFYAFGNVFLFCVRNISVRCRGFAARRFVTSGFFSQFIKRAVARKTFLSNGLLLFLPCSILRQSLSLQRERSNQTYEYQHKQQQTFLSLHKSSQIKNWVSNSSIQLFRDGVRWLRTICPQSARNQGRQAACNTGGAP